MTASRPAPCRPSSRISSAPGSGRRAADKEALKINEDYGDQLQKQIEKIWDRWVPFADASDRLNFYEMEELSERQRFINGESIIIPLRIQASKRKRPYNLALQSVESDRLGSPNEMISDKTIRTGVKIGPYGEPITYYIRKTHPGDIMYSLNYGGNSLDNYFQYSAIDDFGNPGIFHLYHVLRSGQTGESRFSRRSSICSRIALNTWKRNLSRRAWPHALRSLSKKITPWT